MHSLKNTLRLAVCFVSLIGVTETVAAQTGPAEPVQAIGTRQIWFGDAEGNPRDWPEPIFSDGFTPWREIASNFDAVVFDRKPDALGDLAFHKTPWADVNLPRGVPGFGLDAYYGTNRPLPANALQGIVAMGAMLGGTLAGIDYARPRTPDEPENLVRLTKKWFSRDMGAGVFLNTVHSRGGGAWMFDVYPNILACQLADLYHDQADGRGEPTLSELCEKSIDRWHEVVDYLRNGSNVPEFAFKAVQLVDGRVSGSTNLTASRYQPIAACDTGRPGYRALAIARRPDPRQVCFGLPHYNGDIFQSDAAGAFAYLGMLGFEKTQAANDRQLAEWSLVFLDHADYDPSFDGMFPFGALAAARMNAEFGDKHDLQKLLGWLFSAASAVRPRWGMIGKEWDGSPPLASSVREKPAAIYPIPLVRTMPLRSKP